jgi:serine/arginine repetitive matrix protein 2
MAHTTKVTALSPGLSGQEVKELESEGGVVEVAEIAEMVHAEDGSSVAADVEKTISLNPSDPANAPPPRPSLVPLGSSNPQSSGLTQTAPHPKKFNTVNISKKFLERNSSASASVTSASHSSAAKSGSPVGTYCAFGS